MPDPIRVLLVDADEGGAAELRDMIAGMAAPANVERVATFDAGLESMTARRYDAHLVACRLDTKSGVELLRAYRESGGAGPVILIADEPNRAEDLAAMERGAADYLVRDGLDAAHLEHAIRYAVEASRRAAKLLRVRDELETRVAERTDALETMNEALGAEVAERRAAERALREVDRRKDAFLATLAHELRNPLAPLSSAAEILSRTGDAPEEAARRERALNVIGRQVEHMVRLIDDLLDISRIKHGKLELRRARVPLSALVESALETSGHLLTRRRHAFELVVPETPVFLHADPMRLAQLLSNLLSNAAKYTEPGGRIRLEVVRDGEWIVASVDRLRHRDPGGAPRARLHDVRARAPGARAGLRRARDRPRSLEGPRGAARRQSDRGERGGGQGERLHAPPPVRGRRHGRSPGHAGLRRARHRRRAGSSSPTTTWTPLSRLPSS